MFLEAGVNVNMIQKRGKKVLLSTDGHRGVAPLHLAAMSPEEVKYCLSVHVLHTSLPLITQSWQRCQEMFT